MLWSTRGAARRVCGEAGARGRLRVSPNSPQALSQVRAEEPHGTSAYELLAWAQQRYLRSSMFSTGEVKMLEYQAVVCSLSEETLAASGVKRQFYFRTYISQKGLENNQNLSFCRRMQT